MSNEHTTPMVITNVNPVKTNTNLDNLTFLPAMMKNMKLSNKKKPSNKEPNTSKRRITPANEILMMLWVSVYQ